MQIDDSDEDQLSEEEIDKFVREEEYQRDAHARKQEILLILHDEIEQDSEDNLEIKARKLQAVKAASEDLDDIFVTSSSNAGCIDDGCVPCGRRTIEKFDLKYD